MNGNKTKLKLPTLSIGIPAYNEENTVGNLLESIFKQKRQNFVLEKVFVICDGCTDNTVKVVMNLAKKYPEIALVARNQRSGKVTALNYIYDTNTSDYIMAIDADLVIINPDALDLMIAEISADRLLNFVGPRHVPIPSDSLFGRFANISYLSFEDAFLKLNNGNNFYACMGAYLLRKKFSKTIKYDKDVQGDQVYLYAWATRKNHNAFKLVKEAKVYFGTAQTFMDWRILGTRSVIGDKANVVKYFGASVLDRYYMPRGLYVRSLIKWFFINPFDSMGALLMNLYIRLFPLKKKMPVGAIWEPVLTSKRSILV